MSDADTRERLESPLDRTLALAELFQPELFTELCRAHVELYRIGIRVFDAANHKIVDVPFDGGLSTYLFGSPEARRRLTHSISGLKSMVVDAGEWACHDDACTGTRYLIMPIVYEGDLLGKLVVGPYVTQDAPVEHRLDEPWFLGLDLPHFDRLRLELRRTADAMLRKVVAGLLTCIDVACHSGHKVLLTSHMHLESITTAYDSLQRQNALLEERNAQLSLSNVRMLEFDRLKSNFLATVSHELRTPLTSVIGYSEMLLEGLAGELSPEQRDYVGTIMEKGESLLQLISGILDISKIEKGAQELMRQRVRPELLVEAAVSTVRPLALKKELAIDVECGLGLPDLYVDTHKLEQVLTNLLSNAVKFTRTRGRVIVSVDEVGAEIRFRVTDTGIGIAEDMLDRIFEVFFQVDSSSTREYGGTGLGLSIVKNFVEGHGGEVSVYSELGVGSTFGFTLPPEAIIRGRTSQPPPVPAV